MKKNNNGADSFSVDLMLFLHDELCCFTIYEEKKKEFNFLSLTKHIFLIQE